MKRSRDVILFAEKYLLVPEGMDVGQPMRLRPWQREIIEGIYDDGMTRWAIVSFARKNGKTALAAILLLVHLVGPQARRNSQIYSAAQSRDQAGIVFALASKMVRMSAALNELVTVRETVKELFCAKTGVFFKALSADADTAYGKSPCLLIHDELGRVTGPRSDLYDALESASGAYRDPLSIIISTQAPTDGDLLSTLIDTAKDGADPRRKLFLFAAGPEDDPWDESSWRKANPALGDFCSLEEMRNSADTAKKLPVQESAFRNLNLNQRVSAENPFIPQGVWELNAGQPDMAAFDNCIVYVGADLSATQDLTAVVAVAFDEAGICHVKPWFFLPKVGLRERAQRDRRPYDQWEQAGLIVATPGKTVDEDYVARYVAEFLGPRDVRAFSYDRWQIDRLKKAMRRVGYEPPMVDFGQGFKSMSPALKALETLALSGRLRHGANPVLTMCIANSRVEIDAAGGRKLTKKKATGRIDGAVALAMAVGCADQDTEEPSVYDIGAAAKFVAGERSVYDVETIQ